MSNRPSVVVEGIGDASIMADIENAARGALEELGLPGPWHVVVRPASVSGRWDFSVRGLGVRHLLSVTAPAALLSGLIHKRLTESLDQIASTQRQAAARRPLALGHTV